MSIRRVPALVLMCVSLAGSELLLQGSAEAYVALMAGQRARPLNGTFNNVPVLHSNQPEIVTGPGILVNTAPGSAIAAESNRPLRNAAYTFNGEFGVHMHHKYYPKDQSKLGGRRARGLMTLALIATNSGTKPITLEFDRGSVKNSFEAPYHPNRLMGVKPLGKRPWNTGPGDATAVSTARYGHKLFLKGEGHLAVSNNAISSTIGSMFAIGLFLCFLPSIYSIFQFYNSTIQVVVISIAILFLSDLISSALCFILGSNTIKSPASNS